MSGKVRIRKTTASKSRMVCFRLDTSKPGDLCPATQARLAALKDEDIDTSDMPDRGGSPDWYSPVLQGFPDPSRN
jgi:hypothetical protein